MSFHYFYTDPANVVQKKNDELFFNKKAGSNRDESQASERLKSPRKARSTFFSPNAIQRKPAFDSEEEQTGSTLQTKSGTPNIQPKCAACENEEHTNEFDEKDNTSIQRFGLGDMFSGNIFGSDTSEKTDSPASAGGIKTGDERNDDSGQYIVEDYITPGPGQMNKSAFLRQMHNSVCATTDTALSGTPFTSDACPYISKIFTKHRNSSPVRIEQLIHRYAPSTASAGNANELISGIQGRVRQAVRTWVDTGSLAHLPSAVMAEIPGSLKLLSTAASAIGNMAQAAASGVNQALSSLKQLFFKSRNGKSYRSHTPKAVQHKLGRGQSLDSTTRGNMENAFGANFSGVEVHHDTTAAGLSSDMNAKAFTVGNQVAFGAGEYRPGTPEGDALIAHELAHVQQQGQGAVGAQSKSMDKMTYNALEQDADQAAYQAVSGIWGQDLGLGDTEQKKGVARKSGLQINRCSCNPSEDRDREPEKEKEKPKDALTEEQKAEIERRKQENIPPTSAKSSVAAQAKKLQTQTMKKKSFVKFTNNEWGFFFSPNNGLNGTASKPATFNSYDDFSGFSTKQKTVIIALTDGAVDERKISKKKSTVDKLKAAYAKWPDGDNAVFQSVPPGSAELTYTCNILVGDSLYGAGNDIINNGKYYSASQIFKGTVKDMYAIDKVHAQPGDIIAYRGIHLGVIVSVDLDTDNICALEGSAANDAGIAGPRCKDYGGYDRTVLGTGSKVYRIK